MVHTTTALPVLSANKKNPNIILFLTDDQGWADTSVKMMKDMPDSKSDFYQTPVLERMAKNGLTFSSAYSPAPTCTPTRTSIQFGKSPGKLKHTVVHDVLAKARGVDLKEEISLHHRIKMSNPEYVTAHFGKWGINVKKPEYDVTDGNTNNGEGDRLVRGKERGSEDDPKLIFSVTKRANEFVEKCSNEDKPFFMQISHYAVHVSSYARNKTLEKYKTLPRGVKSRDSDYSEIPPHRNDWMLMYAAMIEDLDTGLGMLLDKLKELGIEDETYVIFTSDNGGGFRGNAPLSGGKATLWEGGIRVPTVVCGPGVPKGEYCDVPIVGWDFYPTVNDLIGGKPLDKSYDGGSLVDVFQKGNKGKVNRGTKELIFHFPWYGGTLPMSTIRDGDYKLAMNLHTREVKLFNLNEDIGEFNDLSAQMPDKTKQLKKRLEQYLSDVDAEDINDMFDVRLQELENTKRKELDKENSDRNRLKSIQNQLDRTLESRANKKWRYSHINDRGLK
jgi:arylsulfatase A-like enzyme